jgi:hypothetical protein
VAGDFFINVAENATVGAGLNIGFSVTAEPVSGFVGTVTFSVSGEASVMVATWPWGNVWNVGGQNAYTNLYLVLDIPLNAPAGVYPIMVIGTSP